MAGSTSARFTTWPICRARRARGPVAPEEILALFDSFENEGESEGEMMATPEPSEMMAMPEPGDMMGAEHGMAGADDQLLV